MDHQLIARSSVCRYKKCLELGDVLCRTCDYPYCEKHKGSECGICKCRGGYKRTICEKCNVSGNPGKVVCDNCSDCRYCESKFSKISCDICNDVMCKYCDDDSFAEIIKDDVAIYYCNRHAHKCIYCKISSFAWAYNFGQCYSCYDDYCMNCRDSKHDASSLPDNNYVGDAYDDYCAKCWGHIGNK